MFRDINGLTCVANEAMDKGLRVKLIATPGGDTTGLPYVELADVGDVMVGVTSAPVAAGDTMTVKMTFGNPVICKVKLDTRGVYGGDTIVGLADGEFHTFPAAGDILGTVVDPVSYPAIAGGYANVSVAFNHSAYVA